MKNLKIKMGRISLVYTADNTPVYFIKAKIFGYKTPRNQTDQLMN